MELTSTCTDFQTAITELAQRFDFNDTECYAQWKSYARTCEYGDQYPLLEEFAQWLSSGWRA